MPSGQAPEFYRLNYPDVASSQASAIAAAVAEIKVLYRLTATPEMKVTAKTYPNNLGHLDFPAASAATMRPRGGGQWPGDEQGHPVHLRHLPHVPADRPAVRACARRAPTTTPTALGVQHKSVATSVTRAASPAASATHATTA